MAYKIRRNKIQLVRGDTLRAGLEIQDKAGYIYEPKQGDKVLFTVKRNAVTSEVLIQTEIVDGELYLKPSDTENLPYGSYVYDVEIVLASGDKDTIITANVFEVLPEVSD